MLCLLFLFKQKTAYEMRISDLSSDVFSSALRSLVLARNILSTRLKKRVEHGIFRIEPDEDNASSHRYLLTERGKELYIVIMALCQWGENGCFAPDEKRYLMIDRKQGRPLAPLELDRKSVV